MAAVYWITGLSGAGKTTIGRIFYEKLKTKYPGTVFLDGDIMREIFGNDLGYSEADRRKCAMRYSRLCHMLQSQGLNVICCTISMFDSVREWNRENIENYHEIYVKVTMQTLKKRDQKGLYSAYESGEEKELAGFQVGLEEPKCPDLTIQNDGDISPEKQAEKIMSFFEKSGKEGM